MLSSKTMSNARQIQSAGARMQTSMSTRSPSRAESRARKRPDPEASRHDARTQVGTRSAKSVSISGQSRPRGVPPSMAHTKSKIGHSSRSGTSVVGFQVGGRGDDDSDISSEYNGDRQRRVSWAFQHPSIPKTKELSLSETKSLLRSQIRARGEVIPPDFIYLTVNTIQNSMKQKDGFRNIELGLHDHEPPVKHLGRPTSSPSRIDPRTRIPLEDLELHQLMIESDMAPRDSDNISVAKSAISGHSSKGSRATKPPVPYIPKTAKIITEFAAKMMDAKPHMSLHGNRVKSSIPKARLLRPHTASLVQKADPASGQDPRPQSASVGSKGRDTGVPAFPVSLAINAAMGPIEVPGKTPQPPPMKSSASDTSMVPMLMYPADMNQRLELVKQRRIQQQNRITVPMLGSTGRVSEHNGPMRDHVQFKLHTHEQVGKDLNQMSRNFETARKREVIDKAKKQRAAWLAKVTGKTTKDFAKKTRALAPELGEFASLESVAY